MNEHRCVLQTRLGRLLSPNKRLANWGLHQHVYGRSQLRKMRPCMPRRPNVYIGTMQCPVTEQQCGTNTNGDPICCGPGLDCCNGQCVDTRTSSGNCGGCGLDCNSASCVGGVCQCPPGTACGRLCCADPNHPVCLSTPWNPVGIGCGTPGCVLACPPNSTYPYKFGYCCYPGSVCCSTGCC